MSGYNVQYSTCMWIKDGLHLIFNSGQFSGLPIKLPTISILESSGLPTELPTEMSIISVYGSSGQPYLHGKIPMGSPLRCSLFPYNFMVVVDSLNCITKFPCAAHTQ